MSKRIHELAKEWDISPKDLLGAIEKAGIRGKRSQSSLTDDEVQQVKESLGLAPRPTVAIGSERVVSERVVTERDSGAEITAREQTTETRLRANVIRRRPTCRPRSTSSPTSRRRSASRRLRRPRSRPHRRLRRRLRRPRSPPRS